MLVSDVLFGLLLLSLSFTSVTGIESPSHAPTKAQLASEGSAKRQTVEAQGFDQCPTLKLLSFGGRAKKVTNATYSYNLQRCYYTLDWDAHSHVVAWSTFSNPPSSAWTAELAAWRKLGTVAGVQKIKPGQQFANATFMAISYNSDIEDPWAYFSKKWTPQTVKTCKTHVAKIPGLVYALYYEAAMKGLGSKWSTANVWFNHDFSKANFVAFNNPKYVHPKDAAKLAAQAKTPALSDYNPNRVCLV